MRHRFLIPLIAAAASLLQLPPVYAPDGRRVVSERTSEQLRKLLRLVVEYGTGRFAAAPGYVVGGKTGTAEEVRRGRYADHKLRSTFVGVFPMTAPKYAAVRSALAKKVGLGRKARKVSPSTRRS